jgi:nitrite reductase/ring-hydroxylating ferredoxin subunit
MIDLIKLHKALEVLKPNVEWTLIDDTNETSLTENLYNKIAWVTGADSNGIAITTNTCPHSEIDYSKVKTEYDKL